MVKTTSVSPFSASGTPIAAASATADEIKQLERDWMDAQKSGDADKLSQIIADDWTGLAPDDSPLVLRDIGTQEIYALDWAAP